MTAVVVNKEYYKGHTPKRNSIRYNNKGTKKVIENLKVYVVSSDTFYDKKTPFDFYPGFKDINREVNSVREFDGYSNFDRERPIRKEKEERIRLPFVDVSESEEIIQEFDDYLNFDRIEPLYETQRERIKLPFVMKERSEDIIKGTSETLNYDRIEPLYKEKRERIRLPFVVRETETGVNLSDD